MHKDSLEAVLSRMMTVLKVDTDSALARALPVNRQTLAGWRSRNSVPYAECIKFCASHGVSLDWLLTGEGALLRDSGTSVREVQSGYGNPREQALLTLWRELDEDGQREIQRAAEEKKRLNSLEQRVSELEAVVAAGKVLA